MAYLLAIKLSEGGRERKEGGLTSASFGSFSDNKGEKRG